eukprot:3403274-Rhodomonas_salina.1
MTWVWDVGKRGVRAPCACAGSRPRGSAASVTQTDTQTETPRQHARGLAASVTLPTPPTRVSARQKLVNTEG